MNDDLFKSKKMKLYVAIISATIGVISNYSAIKYQLSQSRFDMIYFPHLLDFYAVGITIMLDSAIILFSLMRINLLTWCSTIVALIISIYANVQMMFQVAGGNTFKGTNKLFSDPSFFLAFIVNMSLAVLPIIILKHLMLLLIKQINEEKKEEYVGINLNGTNYQYSTRNF